MKMIIAVALALVAVAVAAPVDVPQEVTILRYDVENKPDGGYTFTFETSDGNKRTEEGVLREVLNEEGKTVLALTVRGSYVQFDQDGHPVVTNYAADENGYEATGELIPQVPQ